MSTSRTLTTGDRRAGAHLEYVKRRRVLRLGGWHGDGQRLETIELPLQNFLERLDIDVREQGPPRWYLLFAGQGRPAGGTGDLTGVFESEEKARAAFHELRAERRSPLSWAQLVMLDGGGRTKPLCWFEPDPSAAFRVATEDTRPIRRRLGTWRSREATEPRAYRSRERRLTLTENEKRSRRNYREERKSSS